ncbi:hypothetical protein [Roseivirga sp.]|uniref:hypothetical protein n=1 Tax=Roseivirga sp. TaxID=1964215 RepID=UPI003B51B4E1
MNTFVVQMWDDEGSMCNFYTVRWDDSDISETDKFYEKFIQDEKHTEALDQLTSLILNKIGNDYGAIDELFNRNENEVSALPPKGKIHFDELTLLYYPQFPLRLFALRITEEIVVLFNGGIKDAATNQKSSLSMQWREALLFAKKIIEGILDGTIIVNHKEAKLEYFNGSDEIIL